MKIKNVYLNLTSQDSEVLNKLLLHEDDKILKDILKYIHQDFKTYKIENFTKIGGFNKTFKSVSHICKVRFSFSTFGDVRINILSFERYYSTKEKGYSQLRFSNFGKGDVREEL